ncbi:hypothetical protein ACJIZ3_023209 [Penstemon smallii]|uniref:Nuclear transcription factor Y subunit n=1 Tax=Penstemon smallii TaxID=265156 RepID=A0ABD3TQV5_9LAMI
MMQSLSNKDSDRTIGFGRFSTEQLQLSLSKNVATAAEYQYHVKQSKSLYQEHDSSSTLSTGKSHHGASTLPRSNLNMQSIPFQPGFFETRKKNGEDRVKPCLPSRNADHDINHQIQLERDQSVTCITYPSSESYFDKIVAAYGTNAIVYPQMMGITQARVVLPLNYTEGIPIYVNAKQYHAILRRRQTRAKLESQRKIAKSRKPYLHKSRHLHALKRARGSGGRFLNTKTSKLSNPSTKMYDVNKNLSLQHGTKDASEPEIQHSESNSWGASTPSGSDISCIFNSTTDDILQQHDFGFSTSSFSAGPHSRVLAPDDRLLLSIDRC